MSTPAKGGRRIAASRRPDLDRSAVAALAVLVVAALAVTLSRSPEPQDVDRPSAGTFVNRTQLACPDADEGLGAVAPAQVAVGLAPVEDLGEQGTLTVNDKSTSVRRGSVVRVPGSPAPVLDASGDVAAGLFAHRGDVQGSDTAVAACVAPRADWWFVGAGAGLDHESAVTVTNVDPGPAVVDLRVLGEDGEIEALDTRGITVAPGETTEIFLGDAAPGNAELAVNVRASRGRVVAAVADQLVTRPGAPAGLEWLTGTEEPRRLIRLAGLPALAQERTLLVANTSELEALVDLEVSGEGGTFVPSGSETVNVPPGTVQVVDVTDLFAADEATAVRLTSQVPVVATVRSTRGGDVSYAAVAEPLTGPAAAPVLPGSRATLQVTAGVGGATVNVAEYARNGRRLSTDKLTVSPAATAIWTPGRRAVYVVVTPVGGNVHGAATYAGPTGIAATPLVTLPVRLALPGVVPGSR